MACNPALDGVGRHPWPWGSGEGAELIQLNEDLNLCDDLFGWLPKKLIARRTRGTARYAELQCWEAS